MGWLDLFMHVKIFIFSLFLSRLLLKHYHNRLYELIGRKPVVLCEIRHLSIPYSQNGRTITPCEYLTVRLGVESGSCYQSIESSTIGGFVMGSCHPVVWHAELYLKLFVNCAVSIVHCYPKVQTFMWHLNVIEHGVWNFHMHFFSYSPSFPIMMLATDAKTENLTWSDFFLWRRQWAHFHYRFAQNFDDIL